MKSYPASIFILIFLLAVIFRLFNLGIIPPSLNWDEVSNGYNAYSILKTGRDEYGKFLPLANRSFDDYKPPLYMYLNVLSVGLLGLNAIAARLPSALFGSLSVACIYFLAKKLFGDSRVALYAMFLFAITPWSVHFSRVGFEANIGMAVSLLSFTILLYSLPETLEIKKINKTLLLTAGFLIGISAYSYHSVRVLEPLLLFAAAIIYRKKILIFSKGMLSIIIFLTILTITPLIVLTPSQAISSRFQSTSNTSIAEDLKKSITLNKEDQDSTQNFGNILHNRRVVIAISTLERYMSHFDINYLFNTGDDNLRHHIENHGLLYIFESPLLLIGTYFLIKNNSQNSLFIFSWLLIAPIASSFGDAYPHAVRSFNMIVPITLIASKGLAILIKNYQRRLFYIFISIVIFISIFDFSHNYYTHYNLYASSWWQYGYKEAILQTESLKNNHAKVIVDKSIEESYIFWLFYTQENPKLYQASGNKGNFGNYFFEKPSGDLNGQLFVSSAANFPQNYFLLNTILYPDGTPAIKIGVINDK